MNRKIGACFLAVALSSLALAAGPAGDSASAEAVKQVRHVHFRNSGLNPELKTMWRKEERARLRAMPKEQRHGWLKRQWVAMSETQRRNKLAELQAKWNALPAKVRQAIVEKKTQKREARRMRRMERARGASDAAAASSR